MTDPKPRLPLTTPPVVQAWPVHGTTTTPSVRLYDPRGRLAQLSPEDARTLARQLAEAADEADGIKR